METILDFQVIYVVYINLICLFICTMVIVKSVSFKISTIKMDEFLFESFKRPLFKTLS